MHKSLCAVLICASALFVAAQPASTKYQRGTITAVTKHAAESGSDSNVAQYDVTVKVGNMLYTVLYAPPNGANGVEYSAGLDLLVLVGSDTLTFNSRLSGKTTVPILRRETLAPEKTVDLSRVQSQYFSMKLQNLSQTLQLSDEQQTKIKPIVEQETGEAKQFLGNPALSRKEQLDRWEKLVQSSDAKMKPLLSEAQLEKLEELRKSQKEKVKSYLAAQKAD